MRIADGFFGKRGEWRGDYDQYKDGVKCTVHSFFVKIYKNCNRKKKLSVINVNNNIIQKLTGYLKEVDIYSLLTFLGKIISGNLLEIYLKNCVTDSDSSLFELC